jgi:hypothetical protein
VLQVDAQLDHPYLTALFSPKLMANLRQATTQQKFYTLIKVYPYKKNQKIQWNWKSTIDNPQAI